MGTGKARDNRNDGITATHWGIVRPQVEDGRLVCLKPFEHDYAPTPNIGSLAHLPYSQSRIRHPMVRESYLKSGPASREMRGADSWVRVGWDQALDMVAAEMRRTYDTWGPSAMFGRSYGWMSTGKVNASIPLQQRLLNLCGGFIRCVNSYSTAAISTILPYVVGGPDVRSTSWEVVLKNTERVILWGCDPLVTNDVDWLTTLHNGSGYLKRLKEAGIKTIAINPIFPDTGVFLGSEWIAPRPGSDCALMLGMIHELEKSGKADHDFLDKYTYGYPEFLKYVMGETDGIEKTPGWAAQVTGIPAEKIRGLAHEMRDNRTMIMMGWGIQRIQYGEQSHWMGYALASVLGQIGLPGGGIGTNYHYSSGGAPVATGPFMGGISNKVAPAREIKKPWSGSEYIPVARFVDCIENPGKTIDHNGRKIIYPHVRMIMWAGGNPFAHQPQTTRLVRAWKIPETVVVTDTVWTATARHADIVLPACTVFEHNDISSIGTYSNDGLVAMRQAIEPQWEARTDYRIFSELAERMGVGREFTEGRTEMDWIRKIYQDTLDLGRKTGVELPSFEEFWEKGYHLYEVRQEDRDYVAFEAFRRDPEANPLATESGKIQLYSPKIAGYGYKDCLGYPSYMEPDEFVGSTEKKYPLAYMACKSRHRMHSQLDGTISHDRSNISNREPLWINPADAQERGIKDGDVVLVRNDRGTLLAGALVTDRIARHTVVVHHGGWYDPVDGMDIHGNSNTLTMDVPTSSLACGNIASSGLVEVERYKAEELPSVTVFDQPRILRG